MLGEKDGIRSIKTKFMPDDMYIRLEGALAQNDYNEINMQIRAEGAYKAMETKVNSNIEKFEALAKKYENY